jgi:hypothetical protein
VRSAIWHAFGAVRSRSVIAVSGNLLTTTVHPGAWFSLFCPCCSRCHICVCSFTYLRLAAGVTRRLTPTHTAGTSAAFSLLCSGAVCFCLCRYVCLFVCVREAGGVRSEFLN